MPGPARRARSWGLWILLAPLVALGTLFLLALVVLPLAVLNFRNEGASMLDTLQPGQYLWIDTLAYTRSEGPRRGEIIVFQGPGNADRAFIKRVIGLPGDEIRISRGTVSVNGQELVEPAFIRRATYNTPSTRLPAGQYFVLGDNRPNSADSHLGWTVPAQDILGKAWFSYWPPSTWGAVEHGSAPYLQIPPPPPEGT